jgi:lipopolysaccharide transport system ATP-binding protein
MTLAAIRVENLGKQYFIGTTVKSQSLRAALADSLTVPFRRVGRLIAGHSGAASDLTESFWALRNVSFEVKYGEVVGIIGRNGAGKSTLLKILSRITQPTEGSVELRGRASSLLEAGTGFHPELTGRENVYLNGAILGMKHSEIDRKFDEIVAFAEVEKFIDTPVKHYSSGMYVRLAFAVAAHLEPEILIVDEVLAVGDAAFQKKCLTKISDVAHGGRTVLFVSHNLAAVHRLCERGIILDGGQVLFDGPADQAVLNYRQQMLSMNAHDSAVSHIIYEEAEPQSNLEFRIVRVEALRQDGSPNVHLLTWDALTLRVTYFAPDFVKDGAIELQIMDHYSNCLIRVSTQPDSNVAMPLEPAYHSVACEIFSFPLAASEYILGGALAVPRSHYLYKNDYLGTINVHPKDVFTSNFPPVYNRTVVVVPHRWLL